MLPSRTIVTRSRTVKGLRLLAALLFLGWVAAQSPHLVHHLFEGERAEDECLLAASSDRLSGLSPDVVVLIVERSWTPRSDAGSASSVATRSLAPTEARAPPSILS
jgi:hypothetical protein